MNPREHRDIKEKLYTKSKEELLDMLMQSLARAESDEIQKIENERAQTAMSKLHRELEEKYKAALQEIQKLKAALARTADKEQLKMNAIFGRGTEKLSELIAGTSAREMEDETEEEVSPASVAEQENSVYAKSYGTKSGCTEMKNSRRKKTAGKRQEDFSRLPHNDRFLLDIESLEQTYGEGNWSIAAWKKHQTLEQIPAQYYVLNTYTPVISYGVEHMMETIPYEASLLKRSFASPSIVARILYDKFFLGAPLYRQEKSLADFHVPVSRQTMTNWVIRFALEMFGPVCDYLDELMTRIPYQQCDETTLHVNKDGRPAGSTSYVWVHITSELYDTNPIIRFCYELTRGTDHLRKYYRDFEGYLTCDAYGSYHTLGKENKDVIIICGCMMHLRRRFAKALLLVRNTGASEESIKELPEAKALAMIGTIYDADEALKSLDSSKRFEKREETVRPLVEEFYHYIESLDISDPSYGSYLKDGITYARNQKEYLCRFLADGNIPIDDGATERHIRPFATARHSFLFCDSIDGAEAMAILYTIVETARANKANVYWYLRYILEEMPKHLKGTDRTFLSEMVPWSEEYHVYEDRHTTYHSEEQPLPNTYDKRPIHNRRSKSKQSA